MPVPLTGIVAAVRDDHYVNDARHAANMVALWISNVDPDVAAAKEVTLQAALHVALSAYYPVMREQPISERDRPDFLVTHPGGVVAVEVKINGARTPVLRQLGRYAANDSVDAVVLASTRRVLLHAMPDAIHGKPLAVVLIGGVRSLV